MAKLVTYDNTGVEDSGGTGEKAPPGVYVARITRCEQRDVKADGSPANDIMVVLNVDEKYDPLYTYIGLAEAEIGRASCRERV